MSVVSGVSEARKKGKNKKKKVSAVAPRTRRTSILSICQSVTRNLNIGRSRSYSLVVPLFSLKHSVQPWAPYVIRTSNLATSLTDQQTASYPTRYITSTKEKTERSVLTWHPSRQAVTPRNCISNPLGSVSFPSTSTRVDDMRLDPKCRVFRNGVREE